MTGIRSLTPAVSRAKSRSEGRAKAVGVGSSALFGDDAPPSPACTCPLLHVRRRPGHAPPPARPVAPDPRPRRHAHCAHPRRRPSRVHPCAGALLTAPAPTRQPPHGRPPPHAGAAHGLRRLGCPRRPAATAGDRPRASAGMPRWPCASGTCRTAWPCPRPCRVPSAWGEPPPLRHGMAPQATSRREGGPQRTRPRGGPRTPGRMDRRRVTPRPQATGAGEGLTTGRPASASRPGGQGHTGVSGLAHGDRSRRAGWRRTPPPAVPATTRRGNSREGTHRLSVLPRAHTMVPLMPACRPAPAAGAEQWFNRNFFHPKFL